MIFVIKSYLVTKCAKCVKYDFALGKLIVKHLLQKHRYKKRKIQRRRTIKSVANRNEQFEKITKLREEYDNSDNPIVSVDTKNIYLRRLAESSPFNLFHILILVLQ